METKDLIVLQREVTSLRAEGKYKETIEACYDLLELGLAFKDHKSILTAHINNAASFYCIGDIEEAFNSIDAYHDVCNKQGDDTDWVNLYNVLFLLHEFNKDYVKAKETLENSISLAKKIKKYNIASNGYSNYSHLYLVEENYDKALEMAKLGLDMAKIHQPETPILELRVKLNLAKAYIGLGNMDASKLLIDEMINAPYLDSFLREKSQCLDLQGAWYSKEKQYKRAFESYTNAKTIVESYNDVYLLKTIQEERLKLCELMNDVQLGYIVQKEYIALLNEINNRELSLEALKLDVKHSISAIEKKANIDYLTGTFNRDYLETTANEWLKEASSKSETITCIVFDIDDFKSFNDEYGHLFGDEVIKQVSKACSSILGEGELIGRYGGDEFVIFMKDSLENGEAKAKQIEEVVRSVVLTFNGSPISVQVSIGISNNLNGTITSFKDIFYFADSALYKAKKSGKNRVCVYT